MKKTGNKIFLWLIDLTINIAIIFALVIIIQKWIIAPFDVHGQSMCDTMNFIDGECQSGIGEKIIINEALYIFNSPERGDVVVFNTEDSGDKYYIKRVIGLPGETVEIKDGKIYITTAEEESFELEESYLNADNKDNTKTYYSNMSVFEVPENEYFLLGENRKASTDSRSCFAAGTLSIDCQNSPEKAFVEVERIRGKASIVWWPLSNMRHIPGFDYTLENQENSESLEEK